MNLARKTDLNMKIAVEGCAHGELDKIYESILFLQEKEGIKVDLLLCCGDFQATRNGSDLECMAVPPKYRKIESFYKYYSGEKVAPVLTLFIGGNHEASNHLWELPHGGWVAPNIYYLGYSGVVNFGGLRIGGLSGIYKPHDYRKGHYECPPYDGSTMRSAYHIRSFDVFKLKLLSQPMDIVMSHDWPQGVYHHGDVSKLYRYKGFLQPEIESNTLGSPPAMEILQALQPSYWFSAHLHVKFPALIPHGCETDGQTKFTKFLALDKCLPHRDFLQVIDTGPEKGPLKLRYDAEWLAILKLTNPLINISSNFTVLPTTDEEIERYKPNQEMVAKIESELKGDLLIPENFVQTVDVFDPSQPKKRCKMMNSASPQTHHLCDALGISNSFFHEEFQSQADASANPDEIDLGDDDDDADNDDDKIISDVGMERDIICSTTSTNQSNPDEIGLDESISDEEDIQDKSPLSTPGENSLDKKDFCENTGISTDADVNLEPKPKVFKLCRRNQALYTQDDEDD